MRFELRDARAWSTINIESPSLEITFSPYPGETSSGINGVRRVPSHNSKLVSLTYDWLSTLTIADNQMWAPFELSLSLNCLGSPHPPNFACWNIILRGRKCARGKKNGEDRGGEERSGLWDLWGGRYANGANSARLRCHARNEGILLKLAPRAHAVPHARREEELKIANLNATLCLS